MLPRTELIKLRIVFVEAVQLLHSYHYSAHGTVTPSLVERVDAFFDALGEVDAKHRPDLNQLADELTR